MDGVRAHDGTSDGRGLPVAAAASAVEAISSTARRGIRATTRAASNSAARSVARTASTIELVGDVRALLVETRARAQRFGRAEEEAGALDVAHDSG